MNALTDYKRNKSKIKKSNQPYINSLIENINNSFELSPSYFQVTKNDDLNVFYDAWILDEESYKKDIGTKKIIMKPNQILNKGEYVNWNNQKWLCTKKDPQIQYYDNGLIEMCNNTLKYKYNGLEFNKDCIIQVIGRNTMQIKQDADIIMSPNSYFIAIVPNDNVTKKISLNARFILGKFVYKISGIDDVTEQGLIKFKIELDEKRDKDNFITGYADQTGLKTDNYTLSIINGDFSARIGDTPAQLNIQLLNNNIPIASNLTDFIFTSSDTSIASVSNTGLITFVGYGICNITVKYEGISNTISINVTSIIMNNYSIQLSTNTGVFSVKQGQSLILNANIMNNGVIDNSESVNWIITNKDGSSPCLVANLNITGSSIKLIARQTIGYVLIKAIMKNDNTVFIEQQVAVKSILS